MASSLEELEKLDRIENIHTYTFHLMKKIVKVGPVDPEIALLKFKKRKKVRKVKHIARSASLPCRLNYTFLLCDAMLARYMPSLCVSLTVCVCVCVSITLQYCIETAKRRIMQITPHDSPTTRFLMPKFTSKFKRGHPLQGRQMQVGWFKIGHFQQITRYNSKTVQDRCTVSIKVE